MTKAAVESRLDVFTRILGIIFIIFGAIFSYYVSSTPLPYQVLSTFYLVAALLILSGFVALISRSK